MQKLNSREKFLSFLIVILLLVIGYFAYNLNTFGFFNFKQELTPDIGHPTIEESIISSNIIFTCKALYDDDFISFSIDKILYKNDAFKFPYKIGETYTDLSEKKRANTNYGEGRLVFLSDGKFPMDSYSINNNQIRLFDGGNFNKTMTIKQVSKLIESLKNR